MIASSSLPPNEAIPSKNPDTRQPVISQRDVDSIPIPAPLARTISGALQDTILNDTVAALDTDFLISLPSKLRATQHGPSWATVAKQTPIKGCPH